MTAAIYLADQHPERDRSLGITRATLAIAEVMRGRVDWVQVVSRSSVRLPEGLAAETVVLPFRTDRQVSRLGGDALHPALARPDVDVWFYPKGFLVSPVPPGAPTLALVHDAILDHYARLYPGDRSRLAMGFWLAQLRASLRRASRVATVSETARGQILDFCARSGIEAPPVDVIFATAAFETTEPMRAEPPFALHLGSGAPHKRTGWLIDAWQALTEAGRDLPPLHVVGGLPDDLRARLGAVPGAVAHGRVTDDELVRLYREAAVLVFPSEIEGFGLPLLESVALGTPVVFAEGTAVHEIARHATEAGAFPLTDPARLGDAVEAALATPREEIVRMQGALREAFAPHRLADRVEAALRAAVRRETVPA
ncbi:MAG: glycosyltransferase [Bacteroidota bacterium]